MAANAQEKKKRTARVRVMYAPSRDAAQQMIAVLKLHGIDAVLEGGVKDIYSIDDVSGEEIMVLPEDLEQARDLLSEMTGSPIQEPAEESSGKKAVISIILASAALLLLFLLRGIIS